MKLALLALFLVAVTVGTLEAATSASAPPLATPSAQGQLLTYSGQILDYQKGFIFFTTGDGYRVASTVAVVDAKTGAPTTKLPQTRLYAQATFDSSGMVIKIALSASPLPDGVSYETVRTFAIAATRKTSNPELHRANVAQGKPVLVTFQVEVPPNTPLTDQVYIATDKSGWQPNAFRMDRIDALHYRYTAKLLSGTDITYLYTRGTWTTVERGRNGLEQTPHHVFVGDSDTKNVSNEVAYWADTITANGPTTQATFNPGVLPTPYNPNPFNFPTPRPLPTKA